MCSRMSSLMPRPPSLEETPTKSRKVRHPSIQLPIDEDNWKGPAGQEVPQFLGGPLVQQDGRINTGLLFFLLASMAFPLTEVMTWGEIRVIKYRGRVSLELHDKRSLQVREGYARAIVGAISDLIKDIHLEHYCCAKRLTAALKELWRDLERDHQQYLEYEGMTKQQRKGLQGPKPLTKQTVGDAQVLFLDPMKLSGKIVEKAISAGEGASPRSASTRPLEFVVPGYDMSQFSRLEKSMMAEVAFKNRCSKAQKQVYRHSVHQFLFELYQ